MGPVSSKINLHQEFSWTITFKKPNKNTILEFKNYIKKPKNTMQNHI